MRKIKEYMEYIKESDDYFQHNDIIDYTLLDESAGVKEIKELCKKADLLGVKSVCILPKMVKTAHDELINSDVLVCTVISFPSGKDSLDAKAHQTTQVIAEGADEVDMVLNYHLIDEEENYDYLVEEVATLARICNMKVNKFGDPVILKVIVESGELTDKQTEDATFICLDAGADYIKTSTGKTKIGAELGKVKIMYDIINKSGDSLQIKASGGIRTESQIAQFLPMVDRFGMGWQSVDQINGISGKSDSDY